MPPARLVSNVVTPSTARQSTAISADIWDRYGWLWSLLSYITLIISVAISLFDPALAPATLSRILILATGMGLFYSIHVAVIYRSPAVCEHPLYGLAYAAGAITFWFLLVRLHPAFYLVLFSLYGQLFIILALRWAVPASIVLAFLMAVSQIDEPLSLAWLRDTGFWVTLLAAASGSLLGLWISAIIAQSGQRKELIDQLQRAQADLAVAERTAGMLEERQRLAREIHDTLAQGFTSIVMHLEAAEQALPDETDTASKHVAFARQTARDSLVQARRVVSDLRPIPLEESTLTDAITRTAARWTDETGIQTRVNFTGSAETLHPEIEVTLLRALQEALANVRKHAHASQVTVTLSYFSTGVILDVQDNGIGVRGRSANGHLSGGFGLQAMRERVAELHGTLLIESEPNEGTTLVVEIPLAGKE